MAGRMPSALSLLVRFAKDAEDAQEIRDYIAQELDDLLPYFAAGLVVRLAAVDDDKLSSWIQAEAKEAAANQRERRAMERDVAAQESADLIARAAIVCEGRAEIDLLSFLSSCLTTPGASMVIRPSAAEPLRAIPMRTLLDLRSVVLDSDRWFAARAWIDPNGVLSVRTRDGKGGFTFYGERVNSVGDGVTFNLAIPSNDSAAHAAE